MFRCAIYGLGEKTAQPSLLGYVLYDGHQISTDPPDAPGFQFILTRPVRVAPGERVSPNENPDEWLRALPQAYQGSYFWAGPIEEI